MSQISVSSRCWRPPTRFRFFVVHPIGSCIIPSPGDRLSCLYGSAAAEEDEWEEMDTAVLYPHSPGSVSHFRPKIVTATVTNRPLLLFLNNLKNNPFSSTF